MEEQKPILEAERELPSGEVKELAEATADEKHRLATPKRGWSFLWQETSWFILVLVALEILFFILIEIGATANLAMQVVSPVSFLAQMVTFIFLSVKFVKQREGKKVYTVPVFCALAAGLISALVVFLRYRQVWTLHNLWVEPAWWMARALAVAFLTNMIYKIYQLIIYKKRIEPTLKIN
jgi:hypothetical protein